MWPKSPDEGLELLKPYFDRFSIRTVLDIGAYCGAMTREFLKIFPDAQIYAFEPQSEPFHALESLQAVSGGRVTSFKTALGDQDTEVEMFHFSGDNYPSEPDERSSHIVDYSGEFKMRHPSVVKSDRIGIQMRRLDSLFSELKIDPDPEILVKMDVEGYEGKVIRGGLQFLEKSKFCFLEIYLGSVFENGATFRNIVNQMEKLGLSYAGNLAQSISEDGIEMVDALFARRN